MYLLENPVLQRELLVNLRTPRAFVLLFLYQALLGGVVYLAWPQDSRLTTDAEAALSGLIQPVGAFKGLGLAMMVGLLSTLLSDAGYGLESGNMVDGAYSGRDGQFYMAIDIAAFVPPETFLDRLAGIVEAFEGSAKADGVEAIYAPGSLENSIADGYDRDGVPLSEASIQTIQAAAARVGVDPAVFKA